MCKTTDLLHCQLMTCIVWKYIDMKEKVFQTIFTAFTIYRPDSPELGKSKISCYCSYEANNLNILKLALRERGLARSGQNVH